MVIIVVTIETDSKHVSPSDLPCDQCQPPRCSSRGHSGCHRAADHAHYTVSMGMREKKPSSPHLRTQRSPFSSSEAQ